MCREPREIAGISPAARTRPATSISRTAPWRRNFAEHAEGHLAMAKTITSDLVEAYSLCPRKAFLLMAGATPDPGPHDYELFIREQAEANRQAHRVRLRRPVRSSPSVAQPTWRRAGMYSRTRNLATGGLHARCDFSDEGERALAAGTAQLRAGEGDRHLQSIEDGRPRPCLPGSCPRRSAGPAAGLGHAGPAGRPPLQGASGQQIQRGAADRRCPAGLG